MTGLDAAAVRARLDHPVVDADGHLVEAMPVLVDYLRDEGGDDLAARFARRPRGAATGPADGPLTEDDRRRAGRAVEPWWALTADARDRATAFAPRLLHERLDELGIDFTVLYPSIGIVIVGADDEELRRGGCRALNRYLADTTAGLGDRVTAPAAIPMHTPAEAVDALEHAVLTLGFKAVVIESHVARPLADGSGGVRHDVLALDSEHDYDPFWARCVELGVAVTAHSGAMGIGLRRSPSRYMYNHVGHFAAAGEALAKAAFFGGVTHRFPRLNFAFLEGGVAWGVQLLCDLIARWEKRGGPNLEALDPARLDADLFDRLVAGYGGGRFDDPAVRRAMRDQNGTPPAEPDDFRLTGVRSAADVVAHFDRFFFGCEADDPTVVWAFAGRVNPFGARLQAMLGSDIGHWDVHDMRGVLPEAYELVERGLLSPEEMRAFACDNAIRLHGGMNPRFFEGTAVAAYARQVLAAGAGPTAA